MTIRHTTQRDGTGDSKASRESKHGTSESFPDRTDNSRTRDKERKLKRSDDDFAPLMEIAKGLRGPASQGFQVDPDYAKMSKRQRKRYVKVIKKQLNQQLKEARGACRSARAEQRGEHAARAARADQVAKRLKARSKEIARRTRQQKLSRSRASHTSAAIGFNLMYENGVCEVEDGYYSETLGFNDVSYQSAQESKQMTMLAILSEIYNYFPADVQIQLSVINTLIRKDELATRKFYDPDRQGNEILREDAEVMNEILSGLLSQGISNLRRQRFLTISLAASDPEEAYRRFARINTDLTVNFKQLGCEISALKGIERLEILQALLRPDYPFNFDYVELLGYSRAVAKDFIVPMAVDFKPQGASSYFKMDSKYFQVLVMRKLESPLSDSCVAKLADIQIPIEVTWHLSPWVKSKAISDVRVAKTWIDKEIIESQQSAVQKGYDFSILPPETEYSRTETTKLLTALQGRQMNLFDFTGLVYTWADAPDKLLDQVLQIMDVASSVGITLELLEFRQRQGLNSVLPLGMNHVEIKRPLLTSEASIFVPFATQELDQEGGNWYYQNRLSNNLVLGDRARLDSPIGFIAGKTGSGKGFFVKNEIMGTLLSKPDDQVIIFDRAGEYRLPVEHTGQGVYATFGIGYNSHLNPLGVAGLEDQGFGSQVAFKADAMIAQAAAAASESGYALSEEERSIIQRCVEIVYRRYADAGPDSPEPTLSDFYDTMREQTEPLAASIALRYERFVKGYADFFNHQTDVDLNARIIGLNFKEVPDSMLVFALISFCETTRNIVYRNSRAHRRTWLYIEEMESLFTYPTVLNYFKRFANEGRKFGLYVTGITQSTESMIDNKSAKAIVKNSDFVMLLKQSKEDRDYWQNTLGLSDDEVSCISESTKRGWGLLVFGGAKIQIKGDFPHDNHIYELFSTDPNEWAAAQGTKAQPQGQSFRRGKRVRGKRRRPTA